MRNIAAVILAAGKGTRMNDGNGSPIPKVMFEINGAPMIRYSVNNIKEAEIEKIVLVVGYKQELIRSYLDGEVEYVVQEEQLGTGHAAAMSRNLLKGKTQAILICYGDMPLFQPSTIKRLVELFETEKPVIAMLSVVFDNPEFWAYGRIIRDKSDRVIGIVEQKDCNPEQLKIKESNPGFYIFDADWFFNNCRKLKSNNVQNEYYLTDMIGIAAGQGKKIIATRVEHEWEALGINNPSQLNQAEEILRSKAAVPAKV